MKSKPGVSEISLGWAYFVYTQLNSRHVLLMPAVFDRLTHYIHNIKVTQRCERLSWLSTYINYYCLSNTVGYIQILRNTCNYTDDRWTVTLAGEMKSPVNYFIYSIIYYFRLDQQQRHRVACATVYMPPG